MAFDALQAEPATWLLIPYVTILWLLVIILTQQAVHTLGFVNEPLLPSSHPSEIELSRLLLAATAHCRSGQR